MQFTVLGPLEVTREGRNLDLGTPKQRAVLAMLAIESPRVVSADRLIDELWADEPPARAMASLQSYISRLRRVLEPTRASVAPPTILISRAPGYTLQTKPESVDAIQFAITIAEAARRADDDPAVAEQMLSDALSLWRGDPIPELGSGSFAVAERSRLHELRLGAIEDRHRIWLRLGRASEIIADAERLLVEHPYRERTWAHLMTALTLVGRQADALAAYRRARSRLDEDLGIEPGPELAQLELDILNRVALPIPAPPRSPVLMQAPTDTRSDSSSPRHRTTLIGRDDVLAEWAAALDRLAAGRGGVAVIIGEPGIGKSSVVAELHSAAADYGAAAAIGTAIASDLAPAFLPWTQVLGQLLGDLPSSVISEAFADHGDVPGLLDPSLSKLVGLAAPSLPADTELARGRILTGIVDGLRQLSRHQPLVAIIDDAHWADPASLLLIELVAELTHDAAVLVAITHRPGHGQESLGRLATDGRNVVIELGGLAPADLAQLAGAILPSPIEPDDLQTLTRRTGGNPLFATELARAVARDHDAMDRDSWAVTLPARVQQVIDRRLASLPHELSDLLAVAALFDRDFEVDVLGRVTGIEPADLFDLLDSAVVAGILVTATRPSAMRFDHDLFRQTAAAQLGGLRRAQLHARVAEELRDSGGAHETARHLLAAQAVLPAERVATGLLDAAIAANNQHDYDQAHELLDQALALLSDAPGSAAKRHAEIQVRLAIGLLAQEVDSYLSTEAARQVEALVPLLREGTEHHDDVAAWWFWLSFALADGTAQPALALADEMAGQAPSAVSAAVAAVIEAHHGLSAIFSADLRTALTRLEQARAMAVELPLLPVIDWDPMIGILAPLALVHAQRGDAATGDQLIEAAAHRVNADRQPFAWMYVLQYRAWIAVEARDGVTTRHLANQVIEIADRGDYAHYRHFAERMLGWAEAATGDLSGVTRIQSIAEVGDRFVSRIQTAVFLAEAQAELGDLAAAGDTAAAALHLRAIGREQLAIVDLHTLHGRALKADGRAAVAERAFATAIELARSSGYRSAERRAIHARQGDDQVVQ